LEVDKEGQLGASVRDRLMASAPAPGRPAVTVGLLVAEAAGEPHAICALLAGYKSMLPASLVVVVAGRNGVARLFEWVVNERNKLVRLSPDLPLRSPISPEGDSATTHRGAASIGRVANAVPARSREAANPAFLSEAPPIAPLLDGSLQSKPGGPGVTVPFDIPRWFWPSFLILGVCALATGVWYVRTSPSTERTELQHETPAPARSPLDLQVSRRGGDLLINWDRNLHNTIGARRGMLRITDGSELKVLPLSIENLSSGQILYVPQSSDVEIQLTAFTDTTNLNEAVRVIQANGARVTERNRLMPVVPKQTAKMPAAASSPRERPAPATKEIAQARQSPPGTSRLSATTLVSPTVVKPPAAMAENLKKSPLNVPKLKDRPSEAMITAPTRSSFQPPVPTRQVTPQLPETVRKTLQRDTAVSVKLKLDAKGYVLSAAADSGSGVSSSLSKAAEEAARSWRFQPATQGGQPTPADFTLTFMFRR
jgi:TonB family protein